MGKYLTALLSIRARLLLTIGVLMLSTLIVGCVAWYWLNQSNTILDDLHNTTLLEASRSHELTKQSSTFATSAPLLLSLQSSYLLEAEGNKLLNAIDTAIAPWRTASSASPDNQPQSIQTVNILTRMRQSMLSLIEQTQALSVKQDATRLYTVQLAGLERDISLAASLTDKHEHYASVWEAQVAVNLLIKASYATSLFSMGEYRRRFEQLQSRHKAQPENAPWTDSVFSSMRSIVSDDNDSGLFATRASTLKLNLGIRQALNRISKDAATLNQLILNNIRASEQTIAARKAETNKHLNYTKILMLGFGLVSLLTALLAALYVSRYVVNNLNSISTAMSTLAGGNTVRRRPPRIRRNDEIGKLHAAFDVFQANAIKLNRLNSQLLQKTALFESTFNNINDGVAITDAEDRVLAYNPQLNELLHQFGNTAAVTTRSRLTSTIAALDSEPAEHDIATLQSGVDYRELRNRWGQILEIRMSVLPDGGGVWLFSDSTERRRIEKRLQHFRHLENLGQLTGEVAHDVNNILSAVKTSLPLLITRRSDAELHRKAVYQIEDAVDLGSSFTQRLLAFARKQQLEPKVIELNELLAGVNDLIALSLGERIHFEIKLAPQAVYVSIDPLQLESALLNLCINSAHAIANDGRVTIAVNDSTQVDTVSLEISDNGCGMDEAVLSRAIEPFYSTRRNSGGSGLGLSIVYGFMKQSGGEMQLLSTEGKGTTVTLVLKKVVFGSSGQQTDDQLKNN